MNTNGYILIIEDSKTQAGQLEAILKPLGYSISIAYNGKDALTHLKEKKPVLVISDILMPEMDGYQVCMLIKSDEKYRDVPVILLTQLSDPKEVIKGLESGADDFISKPYNEELLLARIKTILGIRIDENKNWDINGIDVNFAGDRYVVKSNRRQILTFLLSTYENAVQQNHDLIIMQRELQIINEQLEEKVRERTEELEASEKSFKAISENAMEGIVIIGSKGEHLYANEMAAKITGYSVDKLLKLNMKDVLPPDNLLVMKERLKERLEGLPQQSYPEITIIAKDGRRVLIETTTSKTLWHGEAALIVIFRDISDRKRKEDELIKLAKLESLGILAGGIAHDFNNILTGVIGNLSLAKMYCKPDDKICQILTDAEKASTNAKGLTYQLLTFAKGGAPVKKTISVVKLIKDATTFACRGSNTKCYFDVPEDIWAVDVDEGQINQVIYNLIINAEQAMPEDRK